MNHIISLHKEIHKKFISEGMAGRIVSIHHLLQLKEEIENKRLDLLLEEDFYQECLSFFDFSTPASLAGAKSIIIVSIPQRKISVSFQWKKRQYMLIIPPTYLHEPDDNVKKILDEILMPAGYRIARASLPLKILAVRSGLAEYGKNNITYVKGRGSFHRLVGFYSDLPCVDDNWQKPKIMSTCQNCSACLKNCPSGAIPGDRFLIKAELCLTFHNEREGLFPEWIKPEWHHCLVGCLRCQSICPANKHILNWEETREHFSEKETSMILDGLGKNELPALTLNKLEKLSLTEYLKQLPRNLEAVLRNQKKVG